MTIQGEIGGLKKSILEKLESIYELQIPIGQIATNELVGLMLELTEHIGREIAVYINRRGKILQIAVGNTKTVNLPELEGRKSALRLSGVRCIHTHPNGDTSLSGPDISSLKSMRFDIMMAVGGEAESPYASLAFLNGEYGLDEKPIAQGLGPMELTETHGINLTYLLTLVDKQLGSKNTSATVAEKERVILAGLELSNAKTAWSTADSLNELKQLAETAGAEVVARVTQKRDRPDNALFFGKGKLQELALLLQEQHATTIIFDDELSASQQRNIERALGIKVLDRTALILDIFAQRARSHEGKLQVELAQLHYMLPRIGGQGLVLSRLGGGIGTRGPGETKLEVDKRRIRTRINDIEKQIDSVKKHRTLHRENRLASNIPTVALVGYTNAGKSTLLNTLASADVLAEDKLFATLDPTTRKVVLKNDQQILITDTVGFIQKLPHQLVSAFRATLEEVNAADLLLHIVDCSHSNYELQISSVVSVLKELQSEEKPTINVFNKIDRLENENLLNTILHAPNSIGISAKKNLGLEKLRQKIETFFVSKNVAAALLIPYDDSSVVSLLHDVATVISTEYKEVGTLVKALIPVQELNKFNKYILEES